MTVCPENTRTHCCPGSYLAFRITTPYEANPVAVELSVVRWKQADRLGWNSSDTDRATVTG